MATSDTTPSSPRGSQDDATLIASAVNRPYGAGTQVLVVGVHGTLNEPEHVQGITERIGSSISNLPNVTGAMVDTSFTWRDQAGITNNTNSRTSAAAQLTTHTMAALNEGYANGTLQRDKPLVVMYVGFSHGGNVSLLAADDTARVLRERGIDNVAVHNVTLSTPAYTWGQEAPAAAARGVQAQGAQFAHTHFSIAGDGVIRGAIGNGNYPGPGHADPNRREGVTMNYNMRGLGLNPVDNHGAPQNSEAHMDAITSLVTARFRSLAPPTQQRRSDAGDADAPAFADTGHPQRARFEQLAQGVAALPPSAGLRATTPDTAAALLQASLQAGFDPSRETRVVAGRDAGVVFAVQGEGDAAQRVRVDTAAVPPGTAQRVSEATATPPTQVAAEPDLQQQARARAI